MSKKSIKTPVLCDEILERIADGETLRAICRNDHMPSWRTFYDWLREDEELNTRFAHARDLGFDIIAEEALAIADTPMVGERTEQSETGFKTFRDDMLGHRKLQVDTRLKLLAKWSPKKYGDKQAIEHSGGFNLSVATGVPDETDGLV